MQIDANDNVSFDVDGEPLQNQAITKKRRKQWWKKLIGMTILGMYILLIVH